LNDIGIDGEKVVEFKDAQTTWPLSSHLRQDKDSSKSINNKPSKTCALKYLNGRKEVTKQSPQMFGLILEQTNECNNANKENLKSFYDLWGFGR
jgi:hypothetical protein